VVRNFPRSNRVDAARLGVARIQFERGNLEAAVALMSEIRLRELSDDELREAHQLLVKTARDPVAKLEWLAKLRSDQADSDERARIDAEIDEIDLDALPALRKFTRVPLSGTLNGEIVLSMPSEVAESTGNIEITIEGLNLGDGKTKLDIPGWGGLTLDQADAGNLELVADIEGGAAKIERATAHGKDLELDVLGRMRLLRPLKRSEVNLMFRVKIQDAYKERSPKVATMLELASSELEAAQTADGAIQYRVTGSLAGRLRPRAAGSQPFEAPK